MHFIGLLRQPKYLVTPSAYQPRMYFECPVPPARSLLLSLMPVPKDQLSEKNHHTSALSLILLFGKAHNKNLTSEAKHSFHSTKLFNPGFEEIFP